MMTYQQVIGQKIAVIQFTGASSTPVVVTHTLGQKPSFVIATPVEDGGAGPANADFSWDPTLSTETTITVYGATSTVFDLMIFGGKRTIT